MSPAEFGGGIAIVCHDNLLFHKHIHTVVFEVKLEYFSGEFKANWVCLGKTKESKGPIIDIIGYLLVEDLGFL